jgi:hypothetical protein
MNLNEGYGMGTAGARVHHLVFTGCFGELFALLRLQLALGLLTFGGHPAKAITPI